MQKIAAVASIHNQFIIRLSFQICEELGWFLSVVNACNLRVMTLHIGCIVLYQLLRSILLNFFSIICIFCNL